MKKKKFILIGPAYPLRGGIADSNHSLALSIQKLGHDVKVLSFSLQYPNFFFPGKSQFDSKSTPPKLNIKSSINSINPISWFKNALWLRKESPDIIISRFWLPYIGMSLGSVLRWSRLRKHCLLLALCDNIIPHEKKIGDSLLTKYFLQSNNQFLVMSKAVGHDIKNFVSHAKIDFHPHPVYDQFGLLLDKYDAINILNLDSSKKYILFFGFVRKYKGLDLLIDAINDIPNNIHLIVAGEFYQDKNFYQQKVAELGIQNRVHFFSEFIPQDQVNLYFSASDIVVQPYRNATQSGVAQIAYHFNKPLLVTNVGGLSEVVPHNKVGYVVDVNSNAISEALNDFYDLEKELFFIANVIKEKKKYSWNSMANKLIKML